MGCRKIIKFITKLFYSLWIAPPPESERKSCKSLRKIELHDFLSENSENLWKSQRILESSCQKKKQNTQQKTIEKENWKKRGVLAAKGDGNQNALPQWMLPHQSGRIEFLRRPTSFDRAQYAKMKPIVRELGKKVTWNSNMKKKDNKIKGTTK